MLQTDAKGTQEHAQLGWKGDPLGIMQEIIIWPCWKMVYALTRICQTKWDP